MSVEGRIARLDEELRDVERIVLKLTAIAERQQHEIERLQREIRERHYPATAKVTVVSTG